MNPSLPKQKRNAQFQPPLLLGMHEQPVYRNMGFFKGEPYPVTEHIARRGLYLPSGQAITDNQIEKVIDAVRRNLS